MEPTIQATETETGIQLSFLGAEFATFQPTDDGYRAAAFSIRGTMAAWPNATYDLSGCSEYTRVRIATLL